jgi:steroid delta-isomerase-like uncharacterized protein
MSLYADDAVLEFPASPPISGKEAIRRSFERYFQDWEEAIEISRMVSSGDHVAAEGTVEGRHKTIHTKIPGRIPVAGRAYRHAFAVFWDFRAGKISRHRVYYDARDLVRQILGT